MPRTRTTRTFAPSRRPHFSKIENKLILSIIKKYKHILDDPSASLKRDVWQVITKEFNSKSDRYFRDMAVLRSKYYSMKKILREPDSADNNCPQPMNLQVRQMCKITDVAGGDSADFFVNDTRNQVEEKQDEVIFVKQEQIQNTSDHIVDEATVSTSETHEKKDYDEELFELKKRHLQELHQLEMQAVQQRINHMNEDHQKKMEEWNIKLAIMDDEHRVKLEIMQLRSCKNF